MKRHVQLPGIRKWAGNDFIELQSEPLKALDGFFAEYGPCIVQGLEITKTETGYAIGEGLVVLSGTDAQGMECTMVVPFEGLNDTLLPLYLILSYRMQERVYADEKVRPVIYEYYADFTTVIPQGVSYLKVLPENNVRFTDALQDDDHRFISNAERLDWNSKATGDHVHAAATPSKAGFMSAQDKQKVETATNDIADIKSGFITVGKAKTADSVAWANVTGKTDATTSASGLMSGSDKTNLGAAMTDIANLKSGTTAAGKVEWANVANKVNASTSVAGLMTAADKTSLNTAVTDIANLKSGTTAAGKVEWANVANKVNASTSVAGLMTAADKTSLNNTVSGLSTATTNITNILNGSTAVGVAKSAQSVAWANVSGKTDATTSASGLMSAADKSALGTATTNITNIINGTTAVGVAKSAQSVAWGNVTGKTDATTSASGLMSAADKAALGTATTNIANIISGTTGVGKVEWTNVYNKALATTLNPGLMSAVDKAKLDRFLDCRILCAAEVDGTSATARYTHGTIISITSSKDGIYIIMGNFGSNYVVCATPRTREDRIIMVTTRAGDHFTIDIRNRNNTNYKTDFSFVVIGFVA